MDNLVIDDAYIQHENTGGLHVAASDEIYLWTVTVEIGAPAMCTVVMAALPMLAIAAPCPDSPGVLHSRFHCYSPLIII
ncbi:hypothetical protein [Undibacterium sp. TS12]|uniref:hypothetical protein n=1 Tax=Undibacterium sp. TS12 TaxID=2908202 RepID=UPI001F4D2B08|nr:hypothetical protein [Undibacterium sp. TS12]MCH8618442.1 hypothetical protein [Undibacterium sp. TS12]